MDLNSVSTRAGPVAGACLSVEELGGLEPAIAQRKIEENLIGKVSFWGKIYGTTQDYLVVYYVDPTLEFPDKVYYFCTTSKYTLNILPTQLSPEYTAKAEALKVQFTGDPSFFAFNGEEAEAEDPEGNQVERFREIHRLAYTVKVSVIMSREQPIHILRPLVCAL